MRTLLFLLLLFLVGCQSFINHNSLFPQSEVSEYAQESLDWREYGAFYTHKNLLVETAHKRKRRGTGVTRYTDSREMYIINEYGVKGATMSFPPLGDSLVSATFSLTLPNGEQGVLDDTYIIEEYRKSGMVVFPKVSAGCYVKAELIFQTDVPLASYEHWLYTDYPIKKGAIAMVTALENVLHPSVLAATDFYSLSESDDAKKHIVLYEFKNFTPHAPVAYQPFVDELLPRLHFTSYPSWEPLVEAMQSLVNYSLSHDEEKQLDNVLATLEMVSKESVFCWVRDSISTVNSLPQVGSIAQLIATRQGSAWDVTLLLHHLYRRAGIASKIVMTRGKNSGGFQKSGYLPELLVDPLVVVTDEQELVAYPFIRHFPLGTYPIGYWDNYGVDLASAQEVLLPKSLLAKSSIESNMVAEVSENDMRLQQKIRYGGYHGAVLWSQLAIMPQQQQNHMIQALLRNQHRENRVEMIEINPVLESTAGVDISFLLENEGQHYARGGKQVFKFGHLFDTYFSDFDVDRTVPFVVSIERNISEELSLVVDSAVQLDTLAVDEVHISNKLFDYDVFIERDSTLTICRKVRMKECRLQPSELKPILQDVLQMREKESWYIKYSSKNEEALNPKEE